MSRGSNEGEGGHCGQDGAVVPTRLFVIALLVIESLRQRLLSHYPRLEPLFHIETPQREVCGVRTHTHTHTLDPVISLVSSLPQ